MSMKRTNHSHIGHTAILVAGLVTLAACGGTGYGGGTSAGTDNTAMTPGLKVASTSLGNVVVDSRGRTVYELSADKPSKSTCSAECLAEWPAVPALGGKATPASLTAHVGSAATSSGKQMATVGDRPVYTFSQDKAAGDVNGEGLKDFGGTWYAVSPSGQPVKSAAAPSGY
jgi:predicted lipoprotein with Yx(FWY)xxD motif